MPQVLDKKFVLIISHEEIESRNKALAELLRRDYKGKTPLFTCVLSGAFIFMADLIREYGNACETAFIKASSYHGMESSGDVKILPTADYNFKGRDIILVEDIVDTGYTLEALRRYFEVCGVASFRIVSLLVKPATHKVPVLVDYTGFNIDPLFVVGYGLDYNGHGRQLNGIYQLS